MCKGIKSPCGTKFNIDESLWLFMGIVDVEYPEDRSYCIVPCTDSLFLPWTKFLELDSDGYCTKPKSYYWETLYDDTYEKDRMLNMIEILRKYHTDNNLLPKFPDTDLANYYEDKLRYERITREYEKKE